MRWPGICGCHAEFDVDGDSCFGRLELVDIDVGFGERCTAGHLRLSRSGGGTEDGR